MVLEFLLKGYKNLIKPDCNELILEIGCFLDLRPFGRVLDCEHKLLLSGFSGHRGIPISDSQIQ